MCEMMWNDPMDMPGMVPNKVRRAVQLQYTPFHPQLWASGLGVSPPWRAPLPLQHHRLRAASGQLHAWRRPALPTHASCPLHSLPAAARCGRGVWSRRRQAVAGGQRPADGRAQPRGALAHAAANLWLGWGSAADVGVWLAQLCSYNMTRRRELVVWLLPPSSTGQGGGLPGGALLTISLPSCLLSCTPNLLLPRRSRRRALRWLTTATPSPCSAHPTTATRWCAQHRAGLAKCRCFSCVQGAQLLRPLEEHVALHWLSKWKCGGLFGLAATRPDVVSMLMPLHPAPPAHHCFAGQQGRLHPLRLGLHALFHQI